MKKKDQEKPQENPEEEPQDPSKEEKVDPEEEQPMVALTFDEFDAMEKEIEAHREYESRDN
mgnify:CR=1 FL=1